jgi:hypothetical protein
MGTLRFAHPTGEARIARIEEYLHSSSVPMRRTAHAAKTGMTIDDVLGARQGQSVNVSLATDNGANDFNIIAPGKENEALFVGSSSGNPFEGRLPASGDDKVRVYLMRSAARRDEIANDRLEMVIV